MELVIDVDLRAALIAHMQETEPNECVGLITKDNGYVRLQNIHEEPMYHFRVSPNDSFMAMNDDNVIAIFHTHPSGLMWPSKSDMEAQLNFRKPFVIAARHSLSKHVEIFQLGDHLLDMPLDGVEFRWNVYDCWEQIRRYFWQQRGIALRTNPREPFWFMEADGANLNLYHDFTEWGFEEFNPRETLPEPGDIILCQTDGAPVLNHAGIYVGGNKMLHHRAGRKSGSTPLHFFEQSKYIKKWVRYVG